MTNFEKLGYSKEKAVDEIAVCMLLERIKNDVDKKVFETNWISNLYIRLYNSMKEWLESEAEQ